MKRRYLGVASRAFRRPVPVAGIVVALLIAVGAFAWMNVQSGFMPKMDEGGFILDYKAKPGAALSDTDRLLRQVETIIRETPEVASIRGAPASSLAAASPRPTKATSSSASRAGARRNIEEVMTEIGNKVQGQVPGSTSRPPS